MATECTACGKPSWHDVCMACVIQRHKTVLNRGKCTCRKAEQRPREVGNNIRRWIACDRCLGSIKQLN